MAELLRFVIRTPHGVVADVPVRSARVPSPTGLVGLRPRGEALVTSIEPGLVVLETDAGRSFAGTCGGLLELDGSSATVLTPIGVVGTEDEVVAALDRLLEAPSGELAARRLLAHLEQRLLHELRPSPSRPPDARRDRDARGS